MIRARIIATGAYVPPKILTHKAAAFDISAGCTSFIHTLSLADKFIKEDPRRTVMVLGAEIISKITDWTDRGTCARPDMGVRRTPPHRSHRFGDFLGDHRC
jgi:3-oxoacyl-[acyl-carrier-protein] synthase III